jgi:gluconokinase
MTIPPVPGPVVVMGVAGCGKTTVGRLLADRLGIPYAEADSFHPPANVAKMARGIPLTDLDRQPWLAAIADRISSDGLLVISCSALKRQYRDVLRAANPRTWFLHLVIDQPTAAARVAARSSHFMPASLVASQFAALEPPHGEPGLAVDATRPPQAIVASALQAMASQDPRRGHPTHPDK